MNKYELRFLVRANEESRKIEGKAISFETESNDLGFIEILHRGCITEDVINSSNIVFTYNHQRDKILARSRNGEGNLSIDLREDGLYFSFDSPKTTIGNDVLEDVRNGNLSQCSFAFTVPDKEGAQVWSRRNDTMYREVYMIDKLFDLSIVVDPAYEDTYVSARSAECAEAEKSILEAEARALEEDKKEDDGETETAEPDNSIKEEEKASPEEKEDTPDESDTSDEEKEDEEDEERACKEEEKRSVEETQINNNENKSTKIHMNKNFSLVKAIRSAMNGNSFDTATQKLINDAQTEMRASGINYEGQLQIPFESRAQTAVAVTTQGTSPNEIEGAHDDVIEFNFESMLKPLRENSVLFNGNAKVMSGLVGDIKVPELKDGGSFAGWAGEIAQADEYFAKFDSFTIAPKRLTVVTAYSKQLLAQDSIGVEQAIREDIINKFGNKLEATIFGNGAGDANTPAGVLNGLTAVEVSNYKELCELEAGPAATYNNFADFKYILSPKAAAALKAMIKGTNATGMVYDGNTVDGTPAARTSFLKNKEFLYLDPSAIWVCQWGGLDITVDTITLAAKGMVKLILNMYVNVKYVRPTQSIVYGKVVEPSTTTD